MDYLSIITLIVAVVTVLRLFALLKSKVVSLRRFLLWTLLWALVTFLVLYPGVSDSIANFLGVDRGTDAAFFASIIFIFYILFRLLLKLENIESNITKIAREVALRDSGNNSKDMQSQKRQL